MNVASHSAASALPKIIPLIEPVLSAFGSTSHASEVTKTDKGISVGEGVLWVLAWFGVMLIYTALDVAVWRKILPGRAKLLNVISIALCMVGFLSLLKLKFNLHIDLFGGISAEGIILAIVCAVAMYLLLDRF